ncbi:MAG: NAD-dependent epimerase/dehydratase family protein [Nocardioidaceae bacterium]
MRRIVLVTGLSRPLGADLAARLAQDPAVSRVIGVDTVPPRNDLGPVRFVRADIRNPVIAKVIAGEHVDTVVHTSVMPADQPRLGSTKEHNVIGTMQLLAACQRAPGVERLIVKSSAEVYGADSKSVAMCTEDSPTGRYVQGFSKDVFEVEGYVRGFARRRPDVAITMLRNVNTIGPTVRSQLADYFRMPVTPRPIGFDARIQLVHYSDLLGALHHATLAGVTGTFNLAGDGVLMLSQAIRRLGHPSLALPGLVLGLVGRGLKPAGLSPVSFSAEQVRFLQFGRGVDTTRLRTVLGYQPAYTTLEAFDDFARSVRPGLVSSQSAARLEKLVGVGSRPYGGTP